LFYNFLTFMLYFINMQLWLKGLGNDQVGSPQR
jgi:hypothetical protein